MSQHTLASDLNYILENTSAVWPALRNKHIFITGGTGFIGTWLVETVLWANRHLNLDLSLTVLTRDADKFIKKAPHLGQDPALQLLQGDVRNFTFPEKKFSHVIHGATDASAKLNQENPELMLETILQGTQRTLDFSVCSQAEKFLFLSSGAVYGRQPPELRYIDEDYPGSPNPLDPNTAYAVGKRAAENMCIAHAKQHAIAMKIARCFAFVGPYLPLDIHFAIGNFIRDGLLGKDIIVNGDGTPYRSYQYATDLVVWLLQILQVGESCVPYNVGSDEAFSIRELADAVAQHFSPHCSVKIMQQALPGRLAERYVPSVQRAKRELNMKAGIHLHEAIAKTIAWHILKQERKE